MRNENDQIMSIKRAIALTFLMFVGVVILAHAVVPHHHRHHDEISFSLGAAHNKHDYAHEDCLLSKVYLRLNNYKQTFQLHDFDFDLTPCVLILFSDVTIPKTNDIVCLTFEQKPYLQFHHSEFITRSKGLRAPPLQ